MGIEHGHAHENPRAAWRWGILAGLCIHAFRGGDGPLGQSPEHQNRARQGGASLPARERRRPQLPPSPSRLLGMLLPKRHEKKSSALACPRPVLPSWHPSACSSALTPALAVYSRYLMAIVIGIFMHISTMILFESEDHHRFSDWEGWLRSSSAWALGISSVLFEA